jgi:membrane-bound metal-dependent hydrolase YbcI (DUF457 family)
LHFVLPFTAFVLLGVSYRKSIVLAAFGVLPDFDVLFHIHRSFSHSAVVLLILAAPIMVWAWIARRRTVLVLAAAATFAVMSHLLLDLFTGFTPLFWPIYDRCLAVAVGSSIHVGSTPMFTYTLALESESMCITHFETLDAPMVTSAGFAISAFLLGVLALRGLVASGHRPGKKPTEKNLAFWDTSKCRPET